MFYDMGHDVLSDESMASAALSLAQSLWLLYQATECRGWVNFRLSQNANITVTFGGVPDINRRKADIAARMSSFEGRLTVRLTSHSRPEIANIIHSRCAGQTVAEDPQATTDRDLLTLLAKPKCTLKPLSSLAVRAKF